MKSLVRNLFCRPSRPRWWTGLALALVIHGALAQAPYAQAQAAQAPPAMETAFKGMLAALQSGSLSDFVAPGDPAFQSGMNQAMLDSVRSRMAPRMSGGYTSTFLGTLVQEGYTIYLWKLSFKDGLDDRLVQIAVRDGKVSGFVLR
jgi:hypothetical protein